MPILSRFSAETRLIASASWEWRADKKLKKTLRGVEVFSYCDDEIPVTVSIPDLQSSTEVTEMVSVEPGVNVLLYTLHAGEPELWWPNGFGGQPLYTLRVEVDGAVTIKRIGFRTIEVLAEDDELGRSMVFRVNGREVFCKGANWIPLDALPSRESESTG